MTALHEFMSAPASMPPPAPQPPPPPQPPPAPQPPSHAAAVKAAGYLR